MEATAQITAIVEALYYFDGCRVRPMLTNLLVDAAQDHRMFDWKCLTLEEQDSEVLIELAEKCFVVIKCLSTGKSESTRYYPN